MSVVAVVELREVHQRNGALSIGSSRTVTDPLRIEVGRFRTVAGHPHRFVNYAETVVADHPRISVSCVEMVCYFCMTKVWDV